MLPSSWAVFQHRMAKEPTEHPSHGEEVGKFLSGDSHRNYMLTDPIAAPSHHTGPDWRASLCTLRHHLEDAVCPPEAQVL